MKVELKDGMRDVMWVGDRPKLLGVMQGHWDVKESEINSPTIRHDKKHGVNYGICIVTPASKIYETSCSQNWNSYEKRVISVSGVSTVLCLRRTLRSKRSQTSLSLKKILMQL